MTCTVSPTLPQSLMGDEQRVRQIAINLIGNAIKFTPSGFITITVDSNPDSWWIAVADSGIGISAEEQCHMWDAFAQADASTARRFGGSGLGLAISQQLATAMGGSLSVASRKGHGSTFTLSLPYQLPPVLLQHQLPTTSEPPPLRTGCDILVVDDDAVNRLVLMGMLTHLGQHCRGVSSGPEALTAIAEKAPDLICLDYQMAGMDGVETAQRIRTWEHQQTQRHPVIPIIAVSGCVMDDEVAACLAAGMDDHLAKPITMLSLRQTLGRWIPADSALSKAD